MIPFYKSRYAMYIGVAVLIGLFKLNWFSAGYNIGIGIVVTAVLLILSGLIGGGLPPED